MSERATPLPPGPGGCLLLTSPIVCLDEHRAVVLLVAQPEASQPARYRLDATVVAERPLPGGLRLALAWAQGRRTALVDSAGCARLRAVPAAAVRAGEQGTLLVSIERVTCESDALG